MPMNLPVELQRIVAEYLTLKEKMYLERFRFIVKTRMTKITFEDEKFIYRLHNHITGFKRSTVSFMVDCDPIIHYNNIVDKLEYRAFAYIDFNRIDTRENLLLLICFCYFPYIIYPCLLYRYEKILRDINSCLYFLFSINEASILIGDFFLIIGAINLYTILYYILDIGPFVYLYYLLVISY